LSSKKESTGLVHVSDITWAKKLKHPKELLKKDQEVDAIVTNIDPRGQRLSLSMKDLTPSAWEGFVATHRPGDTVRGKVTRFTSFGVFVELGEGLEGLCHISELADERVEKPEDVVQLGQEMDFKILRIENDDQKIGLSARAVGKGDEPVVDSRQFSTEAKGGMASLGELANIMKGGAEEEPKTELSKEEKEAAKREKKEKARREYEEASARQAAEAEEAASQPQAAEGEVAEEAATSNEDTGAAEAAPVSETGDGVSTETAESSESPATSTETESEAASNDSEAATAEAQTEAESEAQPSPTAEGATPPVESSEGGDDEKKEESEQQSA
jgi:small subunit ribosomal protein S1